MKYAWLMLNEKISGFHVFGLCSIVTCISLLGFNNNSSDTIHNTNDILYIDHKDSWSPAYAIGFGLLTSVLFCVRVIILKPLILRYKISSSSINAVSQFLCGIMFSMLVLAKYNVSELDITYLLLWLISGVLYCLGILAIYHSYSTGYVGPATAISSMVAIPQTIVTAVTESQIPSNYQIASMSVGVFGCVAVSIGPILSERFTKLKLK